MIVIESGGTKSTWVFKSGNDRKTFETIGLHPQELSNDKMQVIASLIDENNLAGETVYFFGAGCESKEAKSKIVIFLEQFQLKVNQVQTDIYAACVAHLGNQSGIVGIIGTGAVAAQYDGERVVQQTSGLGYILGDEGSGFDIGKRLLQNYFDQKLSSEIQKSIEEHFNHKSILHRIHEPDGRMFIAGLTRIVLEYRKQSEIKLLLNQSFTDFCKTALTPLGENHHVHFIGSVAYYFKEELAETLNKQGYKLGQVKKAAINGVFDFLSA